ncbi:MAG: alpha/beta hydrolase [Myxococcota bacterium]
MGRRFTELPELPPRPHDFASLERRLVDARVPGLAAPLSLSYVEKGLGPTLLLVHGLMTSAYSWRYVISPLAQQYRVIAIDLPGAGKSAAPEELDSTPQGLARVLEGFCDALGLDRPYVVGNSMGGYVTLWWALLHPGRIDRLLITHAPGMPQARLAALHAVLSLSASKTLFRWYTRDHEQFALDNVHYRDESLKSREETREYARWTADDSARELFRKNLRDTMNPAVMRALPAAVVRAREAKALPPMRLLWSTWDPLVPPSFGPRYQALLPEAELVWLENTSHFMHVDTPEPVVREVLRFGGR